MLQYAVRCAVSQEINIAAKLYERNIEARVARAWILQLPTVSIGFQDSEVTEATETALHSHQQQVEKKPLRI